MAAIQSGDEKSTDNGDTVQQDKRLKSPHQAERRRGNKHSSLLLPLEHSKASGNPGGLLQPGNKGQGVPPSRQRASLLPSPPVISCHHYHFDFMCSQLFSSKTWIWIEPEKAKCLQNLKSHEIGVTEPNVTSILMALFSSTVMVPLYHKPSVEKAMK